MALLSNGRNGRTVVVCGMLAFAGCTGRAPATVAASVETPPGEGAKESGGASDGERPPELEREVGNRYAERRSRGPETPPPKVWFEPTHKLSATGETALRLIIDNWGSPVDHDLVDALVPLIKLRDPVAGVDLAFTTKIYIPPEPVVVKNVPEKGGEPPATPGGIARPVDDQRAYVEVIPQQPLVSAWYALGLSKIPSSVVAPFDSETPPSIGEYSIRFNPASAPAVSRIVMCPKGKKWKGVLEFTEPLHTNTADVTSALNVEANGATCSWTVDSSQPKIADSIGFFCGELSTASQINLSVLSKVTAQSGAVLSNISGQTTWNQASTLGALTDSPAGPGCKKWDP